MQTLAWLTAIAITLHNLEEMIRLPDWSHEPNRIMKPLDAGEFRFAAGPIALFALSLPNGVAQGIMPDLLLHILAGLAVAMIWWDLIVGAALILAIPILYWIKRRFLWS